MLLYTYFFRFHFELICTLFTFLFSDYQNDDYSGSNLRDLLASSEHN
jgi:hypothetical protein